ncbi:helix-turn-helix domain-containing protein [Streptacidiphilus monticola]
MSIGGTGSLLRAHRLRRGVTQRQLADLSTVSVRTIRNLEKGSCGRPRTETLQLLAEALRLSAADRAGLLGPASTGRPSARPPEPVDRLIGRQAESDLLTELLWEGNDRFAAVLGLPGSGRTRLALDVAARLQRRGFSVHWQHDGKDAVTGGSGPSLLVLDQVGPDDLRLDRARELLAHPELRVLCTGREAPACSASACCGCGRSPCPWQPGRPVRPGNRRRSSSWSVRSASSDRTSCSIPAARRWSRRSAAAWTDSRRPSPRRLSCSPCWSPRTCSPRSPSAPSTSWAPAAPG